MSTRSRYIRTGRNPLPRKPRSKYLQGSFEDSNRWISCWNCGFTIDREKLDCSGSGNGNVFSEVNVVSDLYEGLHAAIISLDMLGYSFGVTSRKDYVPMKSQAIRGCPLCGTLNLP